ncbi:MAG: hypothetical protein QOH58_3398 [Thermoleophilaceae bacterium]|jgi:hypothetical protein|nr:hypothetical protein [Thermoleophilaceae bacterium]
MPSVGRLAGDAPAADASTSETGARPSWIPRVARRLGLDTFELACLVALAGVSLSVLLPLLTRGRPLSGADGLFAADQLQYFAWIREASEHWLIGNRFDLRPDERVFLHPGFLLSGLLHRVTGISVPLAYLLWKPVAVAVTFTGCLLYVRRLLPAGGRRQAALMLALFAVMPATAVVAWTGWGGRAREFTFDFISGEMWSSQYLLGYLMTAIAVFLVPLVLLAAESWRRSRRTRTLVLASLGALVIAWLQPWQGATLALIVVAVEALRFIRSGERPAPALLAIPAAVALPALYYLVLSMEDPSWQLASEANGAGAQTEWSWPWWAIVLTVLPLAAPAALAYRLPARSWQDVAVRVWPIAALLVFLQPSGTFPYHAFQGLALPLSILAVQGVTSVWPRPRGVLVAAALALLILPGFAHKLEVAANTIHAGAEPYFIFSDEHRALRALEEDPRPGGVLGPLYAGFMLPYTTGREVYVGALSWSPDFNKRRERADALFEGRLTGERARSFVRSTGARFLFADCRELADLRAELRPLIERVDRYGCATVYVLRR